MIRVAIVEDNEADAQALTRHLETWQKNHEDEALSCTVYRDAVEFLEHGSTTADIVFMDIEMPYMNGMEAAAEFRKNNRDSILIFETRATKYAVRGYSVDAIGYLVKPISERAFSDAFEKALRLHRDRTKRRTLVLKVKDGMKKISADRILYRGVLQGSIFRFVHLRPHRLLCDPREIYQGRHTGRCPLCSRWA